MSRLGFTRTVRGLDGLPPTVLKILESAPQAGFGVHQWLLPAAGALKPYREPHEIKTILRGCTSDCGRKVFERELEDAIRNGRPLGPPSMNPTARSSTPKTATDREAQQTALRIYDGFGLPDLQATSHWPQWGRETPLDFMWALYHQRAPLCCGPSLAHLTTQTLSDWAWYQGNLQFIVPHPMTAPFGQTMDGKRSSRAKANTGPRVYQVVEFDGQDTPKHEQARLLMALAESMDLVMVVDSGNKSLHGWFKVEGVPEEEVRDWFEFALRLGADPATWTWNQLVRMPQGMRDNGNRQQVLYFDRRKLGC